jgi:LPXTG-motif cell wall-anchored protein
MGLIIYFCIVHQYQKNLINSLKARPIFMHAKILFFLFLFLNFNSIASNDESTKQRTIALKDALQKNMLDLQISGLAEPNLFFDFLDYDGIHYGKCMAAVLRSKVDSIVYLKLDCGTQLIPIDSAYQTMIVTKTIVFPLKPKDSYVTRFYAMCGQMNDAAPNVQSIYEVGTIADSAIQKLSNYFSLNYIQNMVGQHALWAYTDNASLDDLLVHGGNDYSIELVKNILNKLSIFTSLNPKPLEEKVKQNPDKQNNFLKISGIVLLLLLLAALVFWKRKSMSQK